MSLALNMIARDAAETIGRAIDCAKYVCDELIVVVDTRSIDDTAEVAREHGATVIEYEWQTDDFAAARNVALDATHADWVLVLDSDDEISSDDLIRLDAISSTLDAKVDAVYATYEYEFARGICVRRQMIQRLIRRASGRRWVGRVHEGFDLDGAPVVYVPGLRVQHRRDFTVERSDPAMMRRALEAMIAEGDDSARTLWMLARETEHRGDLTEAARLYRECLDHRDPPPHGRYDCAAGLFRIAVANESAGDAIDAIDMMLAVDETRPDAYIFDATLRYGAGDYASAIAALEHARARPIPTTGMVTLGLFTWQLNDLLARSYAAIGDTENARHAVERARSGHPAPHELDAIVTVGNALTVADALTIAAHAATTV